MPSSTRLPFWAATLIAVFLLNPHASAADYFWNPGLNTGNWTGTPGWSTPVAGTYTSSWANANAAVFSNSPTLTLSGTITQAGVTVGAGNTLSITGSAAIDGAGTINGDVTKSGGGNLSLANTGGMNGLLTVSGNYLIGDNVGATSANTRLFVNGGDFILGSGINNATLTVGELAGPSNVRSDWDGGVANGSRTLEVNQSTDTVFSGRLIDGGSDRKLALTKAGSGSLTLGGDNTHTGGTTIDGGTLVLGHPQALGNNGTHTRGVTIRNGTLDLNGQVTYNPGGSNSVALFSTAEGITMGGLPGTSLLTNTASGTGFGIWDAADSFTYDDGGGVSGRATVAAPLLAVGSSGATTRTFAVGDGVDPLDLHFTARFGNADGVSDSDRTTIVKSGAGTMQLSAANGFPVINVNGGTLIADHPRALGLDRVLANLVTVSNGATLGIQGDHTFINGNSIVLNGSGAIDRNGALENLGGTNVLPADVSLASTSTIAVTAGQLTLSNDVSGAGGLIKDGPGRLVFTSAKSFTGPTTIDDGFLELTAGGTIANTSGIQINSAGTLEYSQGDTGFNRILSGTGTLLKSAGGTLVLGGNSPSFNGQLVSEVNYVALPNPTAVGTGAGLTLNGGNLALGDGIVGSPITVASLSGNSASSVIDPNFGGAGVRTLRVNQSVDTTFAGAINTGSSGSNRDMALTKDGAGTLILTGNHTYGGPTSVSGGTLVVTGSLLNSVVTVDTGARLGGTGPLGDVTVSGLLGPGSSTDTMNTVNTTFGIGSVYEWDLLNVAGPAGDGWDLLNVSNTLTINDANFFTIDVTGLTSELPDVLGIPIGLTIQKGVVSGPFDIVDYGSLSVGSGLASLANVNFIGDLTALGDFSLVNNVADGTLDLYFTATVPEPGTYALMALLLIAGGAAVRRRRVREKTSP